MTIMMAEREKEKQQSTYTIQSGASYNPIFNLYLNTKYLYLFAKCTIKLYPSKFKILYRRKNKM